MKYLIIFLLVFGVFVILQTPAYATCVYDPNDPPVSCDGTIGELDYPKSSEQLIPPPLKQMTLGIKLAHVICDSEHYLTYNTRYEPACVFPDSEGSLLTRGWAKLRLLLPAGPDPIKELELTGQNEMSYRINGNLVYGDEKHPLSNDRIREIALEYSQEHHPNEQYLEYSIPSVQPIHTVGEKIELNLLEWGNYSGCWDLKLRIIDVQNNPVYEDNSIKHCSETDGMSGTFHSYLTGKGLEEFICPHPGYYRIEVSNGDIFSPQILQNFVCLDSEADSIYGFAIDDEFGNVTHYPISELDMMPCEDFISIWDPTFLELNEADVLNEKLTSCRAPLLEVVHANTICSQYWRVELMEMKQDPKYDFLNDPVYKECSEVLKIKNLCEANGDTWIREKLECVK